MGSYILVGTISFIIGELAGIAIMCMLQVAGKGEDDERN